MSQQVFKFLLRRGSILIFSLFRFAISVRIEQLNVKKLDSLHPYHKLSSIHLQSFIKYKVQNTKGAKRVKVIFAFYIFISHSLLTLDIWRVSGNFSSGKKYSVGMSKSPKYQRIFYESNFLDYILYFLCF